MSFKILPIALTFFAIGKIKLGDNFLGTLQSNVLTIVVVALDDVFLEFGSFRHNELTVKTGFVTTLIIGIIIGCRVQES